MISPPPLEATVVAAPGQLSTTFGDEVVILGTEDSVYYGLAQVGAKVWTLIQTPTTVRQIVDAVVAHYDVAFARAERDVQALLSDLASRGLVQIHVADDS